MSFDPVVNFVRPVSTKDPDVLAIKQTLYRVSWQFTDYSCSCAATENGKQVSVLVELKHVLMKKIILYGLKKLEKAGCPCIIYGLVGLKTHSKITGCIAQERDRNPPLCASGSPETTMIPLPNSIQTAGILPDERFGEDATAVFRMLSDILNRKVGIS